MTDLLSKSTLARNRTARVLVVDDEPILRESIAYRLRREGYVVSEAIDGTGALAAARTERPDLIVLDIMLPGVDGLDVCRILRAESDVPILLLSAKAEELDRVLGLDLGADDYLTKPFAMRELLARVRANLRRVRRAESRDPWLTAASPTEAAHPIGQPPLMAGPVRIDLARREVRVHDRAVALTGREFDLLVYLARHPGVVLSRDALLREVWGYHVPVDTRTVDVHISGLRQKLDLADGSTRLIETVRGYGYRLVVSPT